MIRLRDGISRAISSIEAEHGTLQDGQLTDLMERRCVSRLCVRVQVLRGRVYVVAPQGLRRCLPDDRLVGGQCSAYVRQRTDGVAFSGNSPLGRWDGLFSPTNVTWHFAAGVNVSSCSGKVIPGDYNGPFTRLRFQLTLRLVEEAASAGHLDDTEFGVCLTETPINAGGWCLRGAHPIFSMVNNQAAPLLTMPHWTSRLRDIDFSLWDEARREEMRRSAEQSNTSVNGTVQPTAVFRGGVYRLSVLSDRWRTVGVAHTRVNKDNWHRLGRTALLHVLASSSTIVPGQPPILNAHVGLRSFVEWLNLSESLMSGMSVDTSMSMAKQQERFRYVLNVEGHGGWADRLPKLLLSNMLVLAQDVPSTLWFEPALQHGQTHLAVDANLQNLSDVVHWARRHDARVKQMVQAAHSVAASALSVAGIRWYVLELLRQYSARLLRYQPKRHPRAVRFACERTRERMQCRAHVGSGSSREARRVDIRGSWCHFMAPFDRRRKYDTLMHASEDLFGEANETDRGPAGFSASSVKKDSPMAAELRMAACKLAGRRDARTAQPPRWCYDLPNEKSCHDHYVPGKGGDCPQGRPCVWQPALRAAGLNLETLCPLTHRQAADGGGACVAVCCKGGCSD